MQAVQERKFYRKSGVVYNVRMPQEKRDARVTIYVTKEAKTLAQSIAKARTTENVKWSETDVWEAAVLAYAKQKDVREALANATKTGKGE
jgi:hypothetical protein